MKYFIKTYGCQLNFSDSERIAAMLENQGLKPARAMAAADLVVLNTCGVRQSAEDRAYGQVHNIRKVKGQGPKAKIIITGCLAQRNDVQEKLKDKVDSFIPISEFANWSQEDPSEIEASETGSQLQENTAGKNSYLSLGPKYKNPESILVPVMTGCNNFCSYCVVPYARGRERSRPVQEIYNEIKVARENGCREVLLLGQNVNSYNCLAENPGPGHPESSGNLELNIDGSPAITFPALLGFLAKAFTPIKFSFLTSHPKDFSGQLIKVIAENDNISRAIHLPVQSGSDKILKKMNRNYTKEHYLGIIEKIKGNLPEALISTDVIVGFPGETLDDFNQTAEVFQKVGFFRAFINKYSPRPGTAAYQFDDNISWKEKKRREHHLRKMII